MTSKERFVKSLRHEECDRPPIYCSVVPQLAEKMYSHFGMEPQPGIDSPMSGNRISWSDLMIRLGADAICIASCAPDNAKTYKREDGLIINEWGIGMRNHGLYDDFELHPLSDATSKGDIENYPFPNINAPGRFDFAKENIAKYGKEYGIIGDLECSIFETSWYLTGMEKLLMSMAMEDEYVDVLFDKVAEFHTEVGKRLVEMGADMIWCGDDLGSQTCEMLSPQMFDRYFAPRIKRMFAAFREINPDIKIAWHSCGSITRIIPKFVGLGLDVLNPIQPMAKGMDPQVLKDSFGDKLSFFGGICVQELLPKASPEEIRKEVHRRIKILNKNGGFIIAPAHNIQADTPIENIIAFFDAIKEYPEE